MLNINCGDDRFNHIFKQVEGIQEEFPTFHKLSLN